MAQDSGIRKRKFTFEHKRLEASKIIVLVTGVMFGLHVVLSAALIYIGYGENAISLMSASIPVYLAVVAGYFGKAGVENYQKIRLLSEDLKETEYSNG